MREIKFRATGVGNEVIMNNEMRISYNPNPNAGVRGEMFLGMANNIKSLLGEEKMDESAETALYTGDIWYILIGDHREEYKKLFPNKKKCLAYFKKHEKQLRNNWSTN